MINTQHWENERQNQKYLGGGPNPCLAIYHKSEMQWSGTKTWPLSDRLVPNHNTHGTEVLALMSSPNFYCVPPPPSTAVMLHGRHSKHCNTVLVQSQHTAQSAEHDYWICTHYEIVRLFSRPPDITFWAARNHLLLVIYQGPMMEKEWMCEKMC